jgi:hypothetical protein
MTKYLGAIFILASSPIPAEETEFLRLKSVLESYGFPVLLQASPVRGAYGLLDSSTRKIWIDPLVFELGIAQPTLVHEAVHAAQACQGKKKLQPLGLSLEPPAIARRYFLRYEGELRVLESEAYTVQVQENRTDLVISLLHKHCQK